MFLIFSFLFICAQIGFGLAVFGFFDPKRKFSLWEFFLSAVAIGILAESYLVLLVALVNSSLYSAIFVSIIFTVLIITIRFREVQFFFKDAVKAIKNIKRPLYPFQVCGFFLFLIIFVYVSSISLMLVQNAAGALKSTLPGWGDTALHISMINRLATSDPFELNHPLMGGANLTYPFMINFISAILFKLGASQLFSFRLPLYIFGVAWIILLFLFASRLF